MEKWVVWVIVFGVVYTMMKCIRIVPQKSAFIVERFGKYHCTLEAGLHFLLPVVDKVSYKHTLKEQALDVPPQQCITRDNITVEVDGILYVMVLDPVRASYGISNWNSTAPSRSGSASTAPSSMPSTRLPSRGASRWPATRSKTSRRPRPSGTRWRSRCARNVKSAP
jgi:regulator of protease activity HflC (stomatin/prohibitin superfamily)